MKIKTSVNPHGQIYIPKKMREATGMMPEKQINIVADTKSVFMFPIGLDLGDALKSLEIIRMHIEHEIDIEEKEDE